MSSDNKIRVVTDFEKVREDIQEQIKLVYPEGFSQHLIEFKNKDGDRVSALRFETDEKVYLIRMTVNKAEQLILDDDDYDDDGYLKDDAREDYEEKYADVDYLSDNNTEEEPEEED